MLSLPRTWVQSLVGELRSHKLWRGHKDLESPLGKPHGGGEGVQGEVVVVSCRRGSHTQSSCLRDCGHCHGPVAFRVSGQREGAGLGRALAYLERAAEKLPPG